jgi:hypothetical protein
MSTTRAKNKSWQIRTKRWDTHIWTIEQKYWIDLWVRSDMKLSTFLEKEGFWSLSKILDNK